MDRLDLSFPRQLKQYDELGCRLLMRCFKYEFFGSRATRRIRKMCDEFFVNCDNFLPVSDCIPLDTINPFEEHEETFSGPETGRGFAALKARHREELRQEAIFCPLAAERLAKELEEDSRQKALTRCQSAESELARRSDLGVAL